MELVKNIIILVLLAGSLSAVSIARKESENNMKASQANTKSSVMAKAMQNPKNTTPSVECLRLESPNTLKNRKRREMFMRAISQPQGLHVRF